MTFCYVPILKWKKGEQASLKEFPNDLRESLLPIIELLPFKVPATSTFAASLIVESVKNAKTLRTAKFDANPIGIDTSVVTATGVYDVKLLAATCLLLRKEGVRAVPVLHPQMVFHGQVDLARLAGFEQLMIRIRPSTLLPEQFEHLATVLSQTFGDKPLHVVVDMHDIVGNNPSTLATSVVPFMNTLKALPFVTTITFAGGSFPMSMQGIKQGTTKIDRVEWLAFQILSKLFPDLKFGDYSVTNPVLLEVADPAKLNPSVQIRYARETDWMILKGAGARTSGMQQYNGLCSVLVAQPDYKGASFSYGDFRYAFHAQPGASPGNYMTWRRDATSHHVVFATKQLLGMI